MAMKSKLGQRLLLGVVAMGAALGGCGTSPSTQGDSDRPPDVLLVTFCTMRADRIGAYGGGELTPTLDRLARQGVVFRNHYTQASFSGGAFASIITGQYCFRHRIYDHPKRLHDDQLTLAEHFGNAGYATAGFLTHAYLRPKWNFLQGLDEYNGRDLANQRQESLSERVDSALSWVDGVGDRPFFLWYQTQLSHYFPRAQPPWVAEEDLAAAQGFKERHQGKPAAAIMFGFDSLETTDEERQGLEAVYDGAVARSDALLGRLVEGLDARGRFDNTIVVVAADHGEAIGEAGIFFNHDSNLQEPTIRTPLIVRVPSGIEGEVDAVTRNIDIFATLHDLAGLDGSVDTDGRSLVPSMKGERETLPAFSETRPKVAKRRGYPRYRLLVPGVPGKIRMVRQGDLKLIMYPQPKGYDLELYDLASDPSETTNLAAERPDVAKALAWRLEEWFANYRQTEVQPLDLDEDDLETLRSLGYID